jgi:hypothetical protein
VANDGSDQYAYAELRRVLDAIEAGMVLDPNEVYITPGGKNDGIESLTIRLDGRLKYGVQQACGPDTPFKDMSEFVRNWITIGLSHSAAKAKADSPLHPIVVWAQIESDDHVRGTVDRTIHTLRYKETDGFDDTEAVRFKLTQVLDYCIKRGWERRVATVRQILDKL